MAFVRRLWPEAGVLRSARGRKAEAVVWVVQPAARVCAQHAAYSSYVRGLWAETRELRSGGGHEEDALVCWVQQAARGFTE